MQTISPDCLAFRFYINARQSATRAAKQFQMQALLIQKLGFNENYYKFALISITKIVLCSKFP